MPECIMYLYILTINVFDIRINIVYLSQKCETYDYIIC